MSQATNVTLHYGTDSLTVPVNPIFAALVPVLPIVSKLFATDAEPGDTVNTRDLHTALGIGRDYSTWITSTIKSMNLIEGVHYVMVQTDPTKKENWQTCCTRNIRTSPKTCCVRSIEIARHTSSSSSGTFSALRYSKASPMR